MYYLNCFFVYSIIGHIIESFVYDIYGGESGIFYGFWTPIYGIGCVIIIAVYNLFFKDIKMNKYLKALLIFLINAFLLTIMEYIGGILIEKIFDITFWSYKDLKFNIGKYISLEMALVWGLASLLLIYLIKPLFDKFINKIPTFFTIGLVILFSIDVIVTLVSKI